MYFDQFKQQLPDSDESETDDWIDSLDSMVAQDGGSGRVS